MLRNELRKIEAQKKEREKKTQDLQKLIALADSSGNSKNESTPTSSHKKSSKKKASSSSHRDHHGGSGSNSSPGLRTPSSSKEIGAIDTAGIKFPDMRGAGVTLRYPLLTFFCYCAISWASL